MLWLDSGDGALVDIGGKTTEDGGSADLGATVDEGCEILVEAVVFVPGEVRLFRDSSPRLFASIAR